MSRYAGRLTVVAGSCVRASPPLPGPLLTGPVSPSKAGPLLPGCAAASGVGRAWGWGQCTSRGARADASLTIPPSGRSARSAQPLGRSVSVGRPSLGKRAVCALLPHLPPLLPRPASQLVLGACRAAGWAHGQLLSWAPCVLDSRADLLLDVAPRAGGPARCPQGPGAPLLWDGVHCLTGQPLLRRAAAASPGWTWSCQRPSACLPAPASGARRVLSLPCLLGTTALDPEAQCACPPPDSPRGPSAHCPQLTFPQRALGPETSHHALGPSIPEPLWGSFGGSGSFLCITRFALRVLRVSLGQVERLSPLSEAALGSEEPGGLPEWTWLVHAAEGPGGPQQRPWGSCVSSLEPRAGGVHGKHSWGCSGTSRGSPPCAPFGTLPRSAWVAVIPGWEPEGGVFLGVGRGCCGPGRSLSRIRGNLSSAATGRALSTGQGLPTAEDLPPSSRFLLMEPCSRMWSSPARHGQWPGPLLPGPVAQLPQTLGW